mmetsp:Transcript_56987/g.114372  ORF Transcript_56987/g.114372 Transcript_56987/m.114372 type:complete len:136 (-) Transcript_56987:201-608(-)
MVATMKTKAMKAMKAKKLVSRNKLGKFSKRDYGKTIKIGGKKYDMVMIEAAKIATAGQGDGRISRSDARLLCKAARPSADGRSSYDAVEKATMAYIRQKYKFTPAGDSLVRHFIAGQAAKQASRTKAMKAMKSMK